MSKGTIPAISTTMAGHTSDPDPTPTQYVVSATSEIDVDQENGTKSTKEVPSQDSLQDECTPATALEFGLGLDYLVDYPDFENHPDHIEWDNYFNLAVDGNAPKVSPEWNDFDDEDIEESFLESAFETLAAQPEIRSSPYFPNTDYLPPMLQTQSASAQEPATQENTVDPAQMLAPAFQDPSDLCVTSICPGPDLNGSLPEDFELPENPLGLDFLQNVQLNGSETQTAMCPDVGYNTQQLSDSTGKSAIQDWDGPSSVSRVVLAGSSEPNPQNESNAVLTNPRRLAKGYQGGATQRQPDRSRIQRNKRFIENSAYSPLCQAPKSWDIFEYTKDGELASRLFSAEEINRFLFNHPLHAGHHRLKESSLRLRVHKTPASSAKRFPNGLFCRFDHCQMRTINQGQLLVVVDELSVQYPDHDPYLNAAYVHLWCIERYCNFREVCSRLNVSAKGRDCDYEEGRKNKFCLSLEEERVVEDFVEACCVNVRRGINENPWVANLGRCPDQQKNGCPHYVQPSLPYRGTLCHQLAVTKLHHGGRGRINLRQVRENRAGYMGASIIRHLGDLSKEAKLRTFSRAHRNQNQLKPNPKSRRHYRFDEIEGEEQPDNSHFGPVRARTHQPSAIVSSHGTRRNRDEGDDGQTLDQDIVQAHKRPRHGLELKIPDWNLDQSSGVEFENMVDFDADHHGQDVCMTGTPGASPRTTLTPKSRRTPSQLQMITTSRPQDGRFTTINGVRSTISEDESEGKIELEILAARKKRRTLEIEEAKDNEKECRLRKLKLQKAIGMKRAREEREKGEEEAEKDDDDDGGDGTEPKGKRPKV
ncbi:MAG: hypothetical protein Q9175_001919 [Cornicularia normoerica]